MKKLTVLIAVVMGVLFGGPCRLSGQVHPSQLRSAPAAELYNEAANALRMRRLTEARARLEKILRDYPEDFYATMARRLLVEILRDSGEHDQAIAMLKEMLAKNKGETGEFFAAREALLDILYDLQRFREGIELLEAWRREKPNDLWTDRQLARFFLQVGRKDEAWMLLEAQFERSGNRTLFNDLLDMALKSGEVDKLIKTLDDRRNRFTSADYSRYMADCYLALGMKEKAIEVLQQNPDIQQDFQLLEKLADLLIDTGKIEEALQALQKVDRMVPDNWNTIKKMGHCLFLLKRPNQAVEVWRRPFRSPHFQRQDQYMNYTTVLIEHQLYEEALQGFFEARQKIGRESLFAEEVATVLEALGRKNEALEEYIQVLSTGAFRMEVFNKLYESDGPGFDLEKRLRNQLDAAISLALRQALIEFYFRRQGRNSIVKIVEIVLDTDNVLDNFIYERLNQDASVYAANFHFDLCRSLIAARPESTLALRLARMMLGMARLEAILGETAYKEAFSVCRGSTTVDAELKAQLLLDLADFAFEIRREPETAYGLLDIVLQTDLLKAAPARGVEAALYRAHIMICKEDYQQAQSLLDENEKNVATARENIFAADPIGETDFLARIKLEKAFMALNQHDFQKALDLLKDIVENLPETIWANDALEMAMFVTRTSVGDFSLIKNLLRARRLAAVGRSEEAERQYAEIVAANASLTVLITEIEAEAILEASGHLNDEQLLKKITKFTNDNPKNFMTADLYEKELYLLRKKKAGEAEIRGLMQKFIDQFPDDMRSGRFKKLIENKQLIVVPPANEVIKVNRPDGSDDKPSYLDNGGDVDLDTIVPQEEFLDLDETGDY